MKICPIALQICQNKLKILPNTKWTLSKWPKCFNIVPKWRNCAKSCHTGIGLRSVLLLWMAIKEIKTFKVNALISMRVTNNVETNILIKIYNFVQNDFKFTSMLNLCHSWQTVASDISDLGVESTQRQKKFNEYLILTPLKWAKWTWAQFHKIFKRNFILVFKHSDWMFKFLTNQNILTN